MVDTPLVYPARRSDPEGTSVLHAGVGSTTAGNVTAARQRCPRFIFKDLGCPRSRPASWCYNARHPGRNQMYSR